MLNLSCLLELFQRTDFIAPEFYMRSPCMLRYVVRAAEPVQEKTVEQIVTQLVPEKERDRVMATLAEQWIQQGMKKGKEEGQNQILLEMIEDGLNAKFGGSGLQLMPEVRKVSDQASLRKIVNSLWNVQDLEQFRQVVSKVKT